MEMECIYQNWNMARILGKIPITLLQYKVGHKLLTEFLRSTQRTAHPWTISSIEKSSLYFHSDPLHPTKKTLSRWWWRWTILMELKKTRAVQSLCTKLMQCIATASDTPKEKTPEWSPGPRGEGETDPFELWSSSSNIHVCIMAHVCPSTLHIY